MKFSVHTLKQFYRKIILLGSICFGLFPATVLAQFQLNGDATSMGGNCYQLTDDITSSAGSIWNINTYDLTQPFDIQFNIFLGCKTYSVGADGIAFVFQPLSINAGSSGGGMGFGGIVPSLGVEFDTYQNGWDPAFCHVAIEKNGDVDHTIAADLLAGPAQLSPTAAALPDCASHPGRVVWNPTTQTLDVYFDCSLRLSYTGDIINNIFGGNPNVYWGFTGSTGGASNTQQVCMINTPLNDLRDTSICKGAPVQLSVSGGTTYSWSPATGLTSTSIANPVATPSVTTTYTVTITDGCGFQRKDSSNIVVFDPPVSVNNAVICSGSSATLTASGALTYSWSPGLSATSGSSVTANPITTTIYTVTGTDSHGCSNIATSTVAINSAVSVSTTQINISCNGANDGTATVTASGGIAPYTYSWNTTPVQTTATASGLAPGTYTVSVTDSPPCTPSGVELVPNGNFNSGNTGFSSSYTYTTPPNTAEGQYWVATGAQASSWNGGMSSSGDHTSGSGNFMLVNGAGAPNSNVWCETIPVSSNTNYLFSSWVSSLNASSPALLQFSANGVDLGAIFSAPASANSWSQFFASWNSGINTSVAICIVNQNTSLGGNDFGLDDISFQECITPPPCPTTTTVTITEPVVLTATTTQVNVLCNGGNTGSAIVTPAGGTAPYTYSWNTTPVQTTATASNLSAGNYTATITDFNLCTTTASVIITEPSAIVSTVSATPSSICIGQSSTITASATGGAGGFNFLWVNAPIPTQASQSVSPVTTITYTLAITDLNACFVIDSATVVVNPLPTPNAGSNAPVCENQTLNLTSDVLSGNSWSGPNTFSSTSQNPSIAGVTLAAAGVYTLTVTDGNNCQATVTTTVVVNPVPVLNPVSDQTLCTNTSTGAITFVSSPAGASVDWANSDGSIGIGTMGSGNVPSFTATNVTNAATTGNFSATPTLTGCVGVPVNFNITVNPIPVLSPVASQTVCAGTPTAAITYTTNPVGATVDWTNSDPSIGVGAFGLGNILSFSASNSTDIATVGNFSAAPSLNSCNGLPQAFSITVNPLPVLTPVSDQSICETSNTSAINFVSDPVGAAVNWTNTNASIGLAVSGSGDIPAFTGLNGTLSPITGNIAATPVINGCTGPVINFNITVKPIPSLQPVTSQTVCTGISTSAINFSAAPVAAIVNWTNSASAIGIAASGVGDINAFVAMNTTTVPLVGSFAAIPTLNGCTGAAQNFSITVNSGVIVNPVSNITACNTDNVPASAFGSTPPGATFDWTNTNTSIGIAASGTGDYNSFMAANLTVSAATAVIAVTPTLNNCVGPVLNYTITINPTPPAPTTLNVSYCQNDPAVSLITNPATGITWYTTPTLANPVTTAPIPSTIVAGTTTYYVTQTVLNCVSSSTQQLVVVNPLPAAVINPGISSGCTPVCVDFINASGPTGNCTWNFGDGAISGNTCTPNHCFIDPGNYTTTLTVTDANNCVNTTTANVSVYPNPIADFNAGPQPTTILDPEIHFNDATTHATIASWSWMFGDNYTGTSSSQNPNYTYRDTGTYVVQLNVISDFGCVSSVVKNIIIEEEFLIYVPNAFTPNNDHLNDVFLPKGTGISQYELYVFDRWGNKVFQSDSLSKGWDGTFGNAVAQEDVYVWKIDVKNNLGDPKHLSGRVTLIR